MLRRNLFKTNKKTIFQIGIWLLAIIFFLRGPWLVSAYIFKDNLPTHVNMKLPDETESILYYIDFLGSYDQNGRIMELAGWAFSTDNPSISSKDYSVQLVFVRGSKNLVFPAEIRSRPDVEDYFKDEYTHIKNAGFSVKFDRNLLASGNYLLAILITDELTGNAQLMTTNQIIIKTPNTIHLSGHDNPTE